MAKDRKNKSAIMLSGKTAGIELTKNDLELSVTNNILLWSLYAAPGLIPFVIYITYNLFAAPTPPELRAQGFSYSYLSSHHLIGWSSIWTAVVWSMILSLLFSRLLGNWFREKARKRSEMLEEDTYVSGAKVYKDLDEANTVDLKNHKGKPEEEFFVILHDIDDDDEASEETITQINDMKSKFYKKG